MPTPPDDETLTLPHPEQEGFEPGEFLSRRAALRAACPGGIVVVRGTFESDLAHLQSFHQNAYFYYLTGVTTPGAYLVLLPDDVPSAAGGRNIAGGLKDILFLPARNPAMETWTGPKLGPGEETAREIGIDAALDAGSFASALASWIQRNPVVYTIVPFGELAEQTREFAFLEWVRHRAPSVQFRDASLPLARLRSVKSSSEVKQIQHAISITTAGQEAARRFIAAGKGRHEYEVEAQVLAAFRSHGCANAFPSIIGGGFNGTVLHYEQNTDLLEAGDLVVVDIGARSGMYAGDLTRTYPVGGKFTPRHREIYEIVLAAHRHAVTSCRVGIDTLRDMRDRCYTFLKETGLKALDTHGHEHTLEHFMPHGLSHHLGLDVHDAGDSEAPIAPGSVITVEPGIYLPAERFGVRIEDDYIATPDGLAKLGPALAVEPDAVEAAMVG